MTLEHLCRIVKDSEHAGGWALYLDGAYCDHYTTTQLARAAGLMLCSPARRQTLVEINVEDASGRRVSSERLMRPAVAA